MINKLSSFGRRGLPLLALAAICAVPVLAISSGAPPGRTGAPPGDNCTACHLGSANSGSGSLSIEFSNGSTYTPGQTYKIRVILSDAAAQIWGFELTARQGAENLDKSGNLTIDDSARTHFSPGSAPGEYVTHTSAGTSSTGSGTNSWEVNWTAPAAGAGPVTFFAAGNAGNGNGNPTGDSIYTTSLTIAEGSAGEVTGKSYVLPQLAYGGGWYTALYFSNTTDAELPIRVKFYSKEGASLSVPIVGLGPVSDQTISIPGKGTVILEAPNSGILQEGWAEATLPEGVTGYGIFRQSIQGRADQEAVVPLSEDSRQSANMVWDDTAFTTAIAAVNPKDQAVVVTLTAYAADGTQLGTSTLNLGARARDAFVLRNLPGLAGVTAKRGLVRITVPSGAVSALGLRFGQEAFTSIPVDYP
ncbi:MAG: hypothetical protein IH602_07520 [Bryobacteraceae bacterium]|nr:hypothetical protein [Bryobacteraceae bacterium]